VAGAGSAWTSLHGIGNTLLNLHEWKFDSPSGAATSISCRPGASSAVSVHERQCRRRRSPRFAGLVGNGPRRAVSNGPEFHPIPCAQGLGNQQSARAFRGALLASLKSFARRNSPVVREKSIALTRIRGAASHSNPVAGPLGHRAAERCPGARCQLSLRIARSHTAATRFHETADGGGWGRWREPDVLLLAPHPTLQLVQRCVHAFKPCLNPWVREGDSPRVRIVGAGPTGPCLPSYWRSAANAV